MRRSPFVITDDLQAIRKVLTTGEHQSTDSSSFERWPVGKWQIQRNSRKELNFIAIKVSGCSRSRCPYKMIRPLQGYGRVRSTSTDESSACFWLHHLILVPCTVFWCFMPVLSFHLLRKKCSPLPWSIFLVTKLVRPTL